MIYEPSLLLTGSSTRIVIGSAWLCLCDDCIGFLPSYAVVAVVSYSDWKGSKAAAAALLLEDDAPKCYPPSIHNATRQGPISHLRWLLEIGWSRGIERIAAAVVFNRPRRSCIHFTAKMRHGVVEKSVVRKKKKKKGNGKNYLFETPTSAAGSIFTSDFSLKSW